MIINPAEKEVLKRVMSRKGCELAILSVEDSIGLGKKNILTEKLIRDINRCNALLRIYNNELYRIRLDLETLKDDLMDIPDGIYDFYISMFGEDIRYDEILFKEAFDHFKRYNDCMDAATVIADSILDGNDPVNYHRSIEYQKFRSYLSSKRFHIELTSNEEKEVLDRAMEYCDLMMDECGMILRVYSGRSIEPEEISKLVADLELLDSKPFLSVFIHPKLDTPDSEINVFLKGRFERIAVIIGRFISDVDRGMSEHIMYL